MKSLLILVSLSIVVNFSFGQYSKIDSLKEALSNSDKDTNRAIILDKLAVEYYKIDLDTFQIYTEKALEQAKELDFEKIMSTSYNKLGILYYHRHEYRLSSKYYKKQFYFSKKVDNKVDMAKYYRNVGLNYRALSVLDTAAIYIKKSIEIRKEINDSSGIASCYNDLGVIYKNLSLFDVAIEYYTKSLKISESLNNKKQICYAYTNIGNVYDSKGEYKKSIQYHKKSIAIRTEIGDEKGIAKNYVSIGVVYKNQGFFAKALDNYFMSLKYVEKSNYRKGMAICYLNIGTIFKEQGDYEKSLDYYFKALEIAKEIKSNVGISKCYNNIGTVYKQQKSYNEALEFYEKSLELSNKIGDKEEISNANINIGTIYLKKDLYKKANNYYTQAFKLKEEIGDKNGMSTTLTALTSLNLILAEIDSINNIQKTNYLNAAIKYGNKSIIIAKEIGAMPSENKAAEMLMVAYNRLENYKKAMEFAEIYISTKDSLFNDSKAKAIQEIETKYETEKKNVKIKELQIKDIKNQNTKRTFVIIIIFLSLITILLIIFFRQKQKTNKLLNKKNYQLKKLNETQSRLMSIISHDLKAPLSAFFSITSSLKSKIDILDSTTIDDYFNRMLNSALAVKLQLENLLVWSINQSTDINVNNSNYNLLILSQKVIIILEEFAKEKSISLTNNINEEIDINTDGRLLSIALNNIITNAIKFSSNNSEVELSALNSNNKIIISVKDTGIGISKENLKTLFSGKENNSDNENKGTGLGLIVSKDIIEKLGGKIWAESELSVGTTFFIELNDLS